MNVLLGWICGFSMGAGIMLGIYANYLDTSLKCLEHYITVDEIAACVDMINGR